MFAQDTAFVDIETTGGNATRDRITELAILTMKDGKLVSEWQTLINPETWISEHIQHLTGINNDMVSVAPTFKKVSKEVLERLSGFVFIAHNARFDYGFIKNEFKRCGMKFRASVLCTVKLSRTLFPDQRRHNLDSIMQRHGLVCTARHRAYGDARVLFDFMCALYSQLDAEDVDKVIIQLLKKPSLPSLISEEQIDNVPSESGVYQFYDKKGLLLYVGKSVRLRERVLSHFSSDHQHTKEMKISQNLASINCIETAGELGALLLEAKLIKKELPVYNYRLRRYHRLVTIYWDIDGEHSLPFINTAKTIDPQKIDNHFGLFKTRKKAKEKLSQLAKEHQLCEKLLGLETGKGKCFAYQLKRCRGACIGQESEMQHRIRLMQALLPQRNQAWPYAGRIGIREISTDREKTDIHLFDHWCYLGTIQHEIQLEQLKLFEDNNLMFDIDTYRILTSYLKKTKRPDIIQL